MEYRLEIVTNDPDDEDIYYPNSEASVGIPLMKPRIIRGSMIRNIKRQAETVINHVLSHQYEKTSPEYVTHYVDLDAVWKYVDCSRTALHKKIYAAYKDDFEGYQRYLAILTPCQDE